MVKFLPRTRTTTVLEYVAYFYMPFILPSTILYMPPCSWFLLLSIFSPPVTPNHKTDIAPAPAPTLGPSLTWISPVSVPESPASDWGHSPVWELPVSVPESPNPRLPAPAVSPRPYCMILSPFRFLLVSRQISFLRSQEAYMLKLF